MLAATRRLVSPPPRIGRRRSRSLVEKIQAEQVCRITREAAEGWFRDHDFLKGERPQSGDAIYQHLIRTSHSPEVRVSLDENAAKGTVLTRRPTMIPAPTI